VTLLNNSKRRELHDGYVSEVDTVDEKAWCQVLEQFEDANIYQTWSYDEVRGGRRNLSHLLLRKNGMIVAAAQSRIVRLPLINAGIAYVRWGPVWRSSKGETSTETLRQVVRALQNEYSGRRGLVLRIYPAIFDDDSYGLASILREEGFSVSDEKPDRTLLLNLSLTLEQLRSGLRPHWHRYLKVAEKSGLEIVEAADDKSFEMFVKIYKEMVARKGFAEPNDINDFRLIQDRLPARLKMKVILCSSGGEVCAGVVCSAIGKTAVYLFGATSNAGLKARGAYLLHWRLIEWLKRTGFTTYDLNGINPVTNAGTYKFKSDLCGNNGKDVYFLGRFDSCTSVLSGSLVSWGDRLRGGYRACRKKLADRATQDSAASQSLLNPQRD
jgi:peptidoglycan pentaglycine glycine transferase (the first glycine)